MKKYSAAIVFFLFFLLRFTGLAAAAENPFMDVPADHWAYDVIGQLSARGIISGYPDGAYNGGRPVTRYEMASGLARALAAVDADKADEADLKQIRELMVEFQDEFHALGAEFFDIQDNKVEPLWQQWWGWRFSGALWMDVEDWNELDGGRDGDVNFTRARLYIERWFGDNGDMYFRANLDGTGGLRWQNFFVEFPALFGTLLTVGRFEWDWESPYNFATGGVSDLGVGSYLTDRAIEGFGLTKDFALGSFQTFIQRRSLSDVQDYVENGDLWEAMAVFRLQFTEQFGTDLGIQYFLGDGGSHWRSSDGYAGDDGIPRGPGFFQYKFNDQYTAFTGLRYEFNENIGLRGIYYHQSEIDEAEYAQPTGWKVSDFGNQEAYRIVLDVKQEQLGFTSLWLGYDFMSSDFLTGLGGDGSFEISVWSLKPQVVYGDMGTWRVGAVQDWNDTWRTWLYFARHTFADVADDGGDLAGTQWGLGVEYRVNPYVGFALNYVDSAFDGGKNLPGYDHLIRFRTQMSF